MKTENLVLFAAAAAGLILWQQNQNSNTDAGSDVSGGVLPAGICPKGSLLTSDNFCCAPANITAEGTCGVCPFPQLAAKDASGNPTCCPPTNIDSAGVCQVCPIGTLPNSDNSACVPNGGSGASNGFWTGNKFGDIFAGLGLTLATNVILEKGSAAALKSLTAESPAPSDPVEPESPAPKATDPVEEPPVAEPPVAEPPAPEPAPEQPVAEPPAPEPPVETPPAPESPIAPPVDDPLPTGAAGTSASDAGTSAADAAEEAARDAADQAAKRAAALAAEEAIDIGVEIGAEVTAAVAEETALASTVVGIPLAIIDIILTAATIGLQMGLKLDPDSFEPDGPGDWGFAQDTPEWVQSIVGGVPLLGNLLQLLGPDLVFHSGCPDGWQSEANLRYAPPPDTGNPDEWWECHAFLCTLHKNSFENNGELSTVWDVTKHIITDTGTVPDACSANTTKDGAFCYDVPSGASLIGGTAWFPCPSGSADQGALCSNLETDTGRIPDKTGCGDYNIQNCRDDGTSLWSDLSTSGGSCNTSCPGGGPWYNVANCSTSCDPIPVG